MKNVVNKLKKLNDKIREIKYYRDIRIDPKFIDSEKASTVKFIVDEEVSKMIDEDNIYDNISTEELFYIRDAIVKYNDFSSDDLEQIGFLRLLDMPIDDLVSLRVYKEINRRVTEFEIKDIIDCKLKNTIMEYVFDVLDLEEIEELKKNNPLIQNYQEDAKKNIVEYVLKDKFNTNICDVYCHILRMHLKKLNKNSKQYELIQEYIKNVLFTNKSLDMTSDILYNDYSKLVPTSLSYYSDMYGFTEEEIGDIRKTILLDSYDYGIECLFNEDVVFKDKEQETAYYTVVSAYLATIQIMLSKCDYKEMYQIIEDNYILQKENAADLTRLDDVRSKIHDNILFIEENNINDSIYVKRR